MCRAPTVYTHTPNSPPTHKSTPLREKVPMTNKLDYAVCIGPAMFLSSGRYDKRVQFRTIHPPEFVQRYSLAPVLCGHEKRRSQVFLRNV